MSPWDPLMTGDRKMGSYCAQVPLDTQTLQPGPRGQGHLPHCYWHLGATQSPEEGDKHRGSIQGRC